MLSCSMRVAIKRETGKGHDLQRTASWPQLPLACVLDANVLGKSGPTAGTAHKNFWTMDSVQVLTGKTPNARDERSLYPISLLPSTTTLQKS